MRVAWLHVSRLSPYDSLFDRLLGLTKGLDDADPPPADWIISQMGRELKSYS